MANESIDRLARALAESVPEGLRAVRADLEKNFRSVLQAGLNKLDLVTREEFDVQQAVLARTRQKLDTLEKRLDALAADPVAKGSRSKPGSGKKKAKKPAAKKKATGTKGSSKSS